jgi:hypothetical protein
MVRNDGGLDGILAQFRGYAAEAPRVRFSAGGDSLWEFGVRLVDTLAPSTETITVRVPDQHYRLLERWVVPGRFLFARGIMHLVRWRGGDWLERARLLLEGQELMPIDTKVKSSEPAALDYSSPPMRLKDAIPPPTTAKAEQMASLRQQLEDDA